MKASIILALIVSPIAVAAQNSASAPPSYGVAGMEGIDRSATAYAPPASALCPMALRAQHIAGGSIVNTGGVPIQPIQSGNLALPGNAGSFAQARSGGQRLHLTLTNDKDAAIVSAQIVVRGWTSQGQIEKAAPGANSPGSAIRTVIASFTPAENNTVSAEIVANGLTAVTSVELVSVKYGDGSIWTPGNGKSCRVTPDLLMLVRK